MLSDLERPAEAIRSYEQALEARQSLVRDHPGDVRFQIDLAGTERVIGSV